MPDRTDPEVVLITGCAMRRLYRLLPSHADRPTASADVG
jgi:hypothetical protein